MKKQLTIITMILLAVSFQYKSIAQSARAGIKGGLNFSNLYIDDVSDENARVGYNIGIFSQLMIGDVLALQPELAFSTKGAKAAYDVLGFKGENKFNLGYLELPVMLAFKLGDAAEIHFGPYFGYLLNADISTEGDLGDGRENIGKDNLKSFDYGLAAGFVLNFGPLSGGVRYNYGLQKLSDSEAANFFLGNAKNSVGQVYIALNLAKDD